MASEKDLPVTETIDYSIRSSTQSAGLLSRQIWGMLYPKFAASFEGRTPKVWELDSFLCDHDFFARYIEDWYKARAIDEETFVFYWSLGYGGNTHTYADYQGFWDDTLARITLKINDYLKVEFLKNPEADDNS